MRIIILSLFLGACIAVGFSFTAQASEDEQNALRLSAISQECQVIRATDFCSPIEDPEVFKSLPLWLQELAMMNSSRNFGPSIYRALVNEATMRGKKLWKPTFIDRSNETEEEAEIRELQEIAGNKPQYWSEDFRFMTTTSGFFPKNWGFVGLGSGDTFAALDIAVRGKLFAPHYGSLCMGPGYSSADSAAFHGPVYIGFTIAEKQESLTINLSPQVIEDAKNRGIRHSPSHPPHVIDVDQITVFLVPSCEEKEQFLIALGFALDTGFISAEYAAKVSTKVKTFKELRIELEK